MPRKGPVNRRTTTPDPKFSDAPLDLRCRVTKLINSVMCMGRRARAEQIVYDAFVIIAEKTQDDPLKIFDKALTNVKPRVEVKSRRVGGANYQVPVDVRPDRSTALGMRWIITYARARGGKGMHSKLAEELIDAAAGRGEAVKKREDTHKMAEANKAFSHYRW